MRNISFMLTTDQFRARTKDVTRRTGWQNLKPGDLLNACVKCMGLKKGEQVQLLGVILVKSVRREPLNAMLSYPFGGVGEVAREGFPDMTAQEFVDFFARSHRGCTSETVVTRIEYEYAEGSGA